MACVAAVFFFWGGGGGGGRASRDRAVTELAAILDARVKGKLGREKNEGEGGGAGEEERRKQPAQKLGSSFPLRPPFLAYIRGRGWGRGESPLFNFLTVGAVTAKRDGDGVIMTS